VATLQKVYDIINVDSYLSVTDIAFLMHKGGVLAPTTDQHTFASDIFYMFNRNNVEAKLEQLVNSNMTMSKVSAPRSFAVLFVKEGLVGRCKQSTRASTVQAQCGQGTD